MTVRYEYKCGKCGFVYIEQRPANEEQIYRVCYVCKEGDFIETGFKVLALQAERAETPTLTPEITEEVTEQTE